MKKIDKIRIIEEKISIMLNGTSPVNINIPFNKRRPAQKSKKRSQTFMSNINIRNVREDNKSIIPRIFTIAIKIYQELGI